MAFLFPAEGYQECNVSSLLCLIKYNDIVNAVKPRTTNPFFDENEEGLECDCLPECSRIDYIIDESPIYNEMKIGDNEVLVDVHYASQTMMKYRTDVTFSGMDLLVGFGGIVSLFLGCSLLSGAEIIYFTTISLFCHRKRIKMTKNEFITVVKTKFPFLH